MVKLECVPQEVIYISLSARDGHTLHFYHIIQYQRNFHLAFAFWNNSSIGLIEFANPTWDIIPQGIYQQPYQWITNTPPILFSNLKLLIDLNGMG